MISYRTILRERIDECEGTSPVQVFGKLTLGNEKGVLAHEYHEAGSDSSSPPRDFGREFDSAQRHNRNRSLDSFMSSPMSMDSYNFSDDSRHGQEDEHGPLGAFKHRRQSSNFSNTSSSSPRMSSTYCRHHFINGQQQDFISNKNVVVKCPVCRFPGPGNSDDSGICSASASTVSGTSAITNGSLSESDDFPHDSASPRLSFDSNSLNEDYGEGDEEQVVGAAAQLQFLNEDEEEEGTDGELTLVSSLVSNVDIEDVDAVDSGVTGDEMSMATDSVVEEDTTPPSTESPTAELKAKPDQTSLFNRFRNNFEIGSKAPTTTPSKPPTVGHTVTSGMRSVLKLNLKGRTKKSCVTPPSEAINKPPTPGCHTGIGIWTSVTRAASSKISSINSNNGGQNGETMLDDAHDSLPCSQPELSVPVNSSIPTMINTSNKEDQGDQTPESSKRNEKSESKTSIKSEQSSKQTWLLRFFESQVFNMSYAIGYLFTSKDTGVQQYLGNEYDAFDHLSP